MNILIFPSKSYKAQLKIKNVTQQQSKFNLTLFAEYLQNGFREATAVQFLLRAVTTTWARNVLIRLLSTILCLLIIIVIPKTYPVLLVIHAATRVPITVTKEIIVTVRRHCRNNNNIGDENNKSEHPWKSSHSFFNIGLSLGEKLIH